MQGKYLIANPFLADVYFKRSVIFVTEHNDQGSLGFIMNKPSGLFVRDMFPHIKNGNFPVYEGGPVSKNNLYYIHTLGQKLSDSIAIEKGLYWGGNFFELAHMIEHGKIKSYEIRFFVGYAGWTEGQLQEEIQANSWFVSPANKDLLLSMDHKELWGEELKKIKSGYKAFSDFSFDPSLN